MLKVDFITIEVVKDMLGISTPEQYAEKFGHLKKTKNQENSEAWFRLGTLYLPGIAPKGNGSQVVKYLQKAAESDYSPAQTLLGLAYLHATNADIAQALEWLNKAVTHNDQVALYVLYQLHTDGKGVPLDIKKAVYLLKESAKGGYPRAQKTLAAEYMLGNVVDKDLKEATAWLTKAAEQKFAEAQNMLGGMYFNGVGVAQDYLEALKWFSAASDQGYAEAQNNLGWMYYKGLGIKQNHARAVELFVQASDQGYVQSYYRLGVMYMDGLGVKQDFSKGAKLIKKAADHDHLEGIRHVGFLYEQGLGLKKDLQKAKQYYAVAAARGNRLAKDRLDELNNPGRPRMSEPLDPFKLIPR